MATSLGVAVIGAGMAGRAHAAGYRAAAGLYGPGLPPVDLVAIADVNPEFAAETARRYGYSRAETDWHAIADAPDVDVVSIVVANTLHREIAEGLLAAGKHVLCEKPMAPSVEDAESMTAAAETAAAGGQQAGIGFVFRRSPAIAAIRQQLGGSADERASLGRPLHFNGHYWCDYGCDPGGPMSWRYRGGPGSGALADIGSHLVDTAEFLCGPIQSVRGAVLSTAIPQRARPIGTAVGHAAVAVSDDFDPVENEDLVTFTASFSSGTTGTFSASRVAYGLPNSLGFEVFGERGAAVFDLARAGEFQIIDGSPAVNNGYRQVLAGPAHPYLAGGMAMDFPGVNYGQNDLFVFQARAFLEQVAGTVDKPIDSAGQLPKVPPFADGLRNLRVLRAVVESDKAGGDAVTVD